MDLAEIRIKLDEIDKQIENLFEERMRLCGEVAEFKIRTGKPVYDAKREQEKIEALTGMALQIWDSRRCRSWIRQADVLHFRDLPELMGMQPPFSISEKTRTFIMSADLKI